MIVSRDSFIMSDHVSWFSLSIMMLRMNGSGGSSENTKVVSEGLSVAFEMKLLLGSAANTFLHIRRVPVLSDTITLTLLPETAPIQSRAEHVNNSVFFMIINFTIFKF